MDIKTRFEEMDGCQGYTEDYGADGSEFYCGYEVEFECGDCIFNDGHLDPRISVTGMEEEEG